MSWATNFLILTGSLAMIFLIIILIMIIGLLWRIRSSINKVEQISTQLQAFGNIPIQLVERRLQSKDKPVQ